MRFRELTLALLLGCIGLTAVAQEYTEIVGSLSGTLTVADSPYLAIGTIVVQNDNSLHIEPGVEVFVRTDNLNSFLIYGRLIANGTPDSLISFEAYLPENPTDLTWNGLLYYGTIWADTADIDLSYVSIQNANFAVRIIDREGDVFVHHNVLTNCLHGIYLANALNSHIYNNTIYNMSETGFAISSSNLSPPALEQHIFENNIISNAWGGIYVYWNPDSMIHDGSVIEIACDQYTIDYNDLDTESDAVYFPQNDCVFDTLHNIFEDPRFYDDNYYLRDDSPCIDAGNPSYPWDPDETPPDQGATFFNQALLAANYDELFPDSVAVVDHPFYDVILAAGHPTPVNEMISGPPGITYNDTTGLLWMYPTIEDTGRYQMIFHAWNFYNDTLWVDTLKYDLEIIPNTSPTIDSFEPQCFLISGDTSICQGYFPLDTISLSVSCFDSESDLIHYRWRYNNLDSSGTTFTVQLAHEGDNLVQFFVHDGADTTWHYWKFQATGYDLSGLIFQDRLTTEEGPYILKGSAWVGAGRSLTMEPGVRVFVVQDDEEVELQVMGNLKVEGTADEPVQFFGGTLSDYLWKGIRLLPGSQGADIRYLQLSSAVRGVFAQFTDGPVVLSHCDFSWDSIGVQVHYSDLQISNCTFDYPLAYVNNKRSFYGVFVEGDNQTRISNCGFGRVFDPIYLYRADAEIINNTFAHGVQRTPTLQLHPITLLASNVRVVNNIFHNYYDVALFLDPDCQWSEIAYNCFYIPPQDTIDAPVSQHPEVVSDSSIFANPLLVDPAGFDLRLQAGSPCINTGAPYLLDPDDSRSDMGMFGGPGADNSLPRGAPGPPTQPAVFNLTRVFPNPFNATTSIDFTLQVEGATRLEVFNLRGQLVTVLLDGHAGAGRHIFSFDGNGHASGVYLVRLQQGQQIATGKMLLVK